MFLIIKNVLYKTFQPQDQLLALCHGVYDCDFGDDACDDAVLGNSVDSRLYCPFDVVFI